MLVLRDRDTAREKVVVPQLVVNKGRNQAQFNPVSYTHLTLPTTAEV